MLCLNSTPWLHWHIMKHAWTFYLKFSKYNNECVPSTKCIAKNQSENMFERVVWTYFLPKYLIYLMETKTAGLITKKCRHQSNPKFCLHNNQFVSLFHANPPSPHQNNNNNKTCYILLYSLNYIPSISKECLNHRKSQLCVWEQFKYL